MYTQYIHRSVTSFTLDAALVKHGFKGPASSTMKCVFPVSNLYYWLPKSFDGLQTDNESTQRLNVKTGRSHGITSRVV